MKRQRRAIQNGQNDLHKKLVRKEEDEDEDDNEEEGIDNNESLSSSSSSSSSFSESDSEESDDVPAIEQDMYKALQDKDLEAALDLIEQDELEVCRRNGVKPPKGARKQTQISHLVDYEDVYGQTPLLLASKLGVQRIVMGLLLRGADANYENRLGQTPLTTACTYGNSRVCSTLIEKGNKYIPAFVLYKNKHDKTAYDYLSAKNSAKIKPILDAAALWQNSAKMKSDLRQIRRDRRKRQAAFKQEIAFAQASSGYSSSDSDSQEDQPDGSGPMGELSKQVQHVWKRGSITRPAKTLFRRVSHALTSSDLLNKKRKVEAAITIQTFMRTYLSRKRFKTAVKARLAEARYHEKQIKYALKIQNIFRASRAKRLVRKLLRLHKSAARIQAIFRGYIERRDHQRFLAIVREKQQAYFRSKSHRGWMGKFAARAQDKLWEASAEKAAALLIRWSRGCLARKRLESRRRERDAAVLIQKHSRRMLARLPWRVRQVQFQRMTDSKRNKLFQCLQCLSNIVHNLEFKREIIAARKIAVKAKKFAKKVACESSDGYVFKAATAIQRVFRGFQDRKIAALYRRQHLKFIGQLEACMTIQSLVPKRQEKKIAPQEMYGYCGKCKECKRYSPMEIHGEEEEYICSCGHHITNHVLGAYRSMEKDYFGEHKIKRLNVRFLSNVGVMSDQELENARKGWLKEKTKFGVGPESSKESKQSVNDSLYAKQKARRRMERKQQQEAKQKLAKVITEVEQQWKLDDVRVRQKRKLLEELKKRKQEEQQLKILLLQEQGLKESLQRNRDRIHHARIQENAKRRSDLRKLQRRKLSSLTARHPPESRQHFNSPLRSHNHVAIETGGVYDFQNKLESPEEVMESGIFSREDEDELVVEVPQSPPTPVQRISAETQTNGSQDAQLLSMITTIDAKVIKATSLAPILSPSSKQSSPSFKSPTSMEDIGHFLASLQNGGGGGGGSSPSSTHNLRKAHSTRKRLRLQRVSNTSDDLDHSLDVLQLTQTPLVVGRGEGCDVVLDSCKHPKMVSKRHCVLHINWRSSTVQVTDLDSTNGTVINWKLRVSPKHPVTMLPGDVITFGRWNPMQAEVNSELSYRLEI